MTGAPKRGLLLLSDDELVRRGLKAAVAEEDCYCSEHPAQDAARLAGLAASALCPVVHVIRATSTDRYLPTIEAVRLIATQTAAPDVLTILPDELPDLVLLRVVEAGATVGYRYSEVAREPSVLVRAARQGEVDAAARLPTRWALRETLGLAWDGDIQTFLDHAAALPPDLWLTDRTQERLSVSRRQLANVRVLARDVAGLPPPDFHRFTGAQRTPPVSPEWASVRALVRALWGWEHARLG